MNRSHKNMAFYIETVLIVLFLLFAATVLTKLFVQARGMSLNAELTTDSVLIAQDAAEIFSVADDTDEFVKLLEKRYNTEASINAKTVSVRADDYLLRVECNSVVQVQGTTNYAHLCVYHGADLIYELDTARYASAEVDSYGG